MAKDQNRRRALDALTSSQTLTAAASAAGISRRRLFDYLHDDAEFQEAYRQRVQLESMENLERLSVERTAAIEVLSEIMNDSDQSATTRLRAAALILSAEQHDRQVVTNMLDDNIEQTRRKNFWTKYKGGV